MACLFIIQYAYVTRKRKKKIKKSKATLAFYSITTTYTQPVKNRVSCFLSICNY